MRSLRIAGAVIAALIAVSAVLLSTPSPAAATTTYTAGLTSTTGTTADWGNNNGMSATQVTTGANAGTLASVSLRISAVQAAPANHGQVAVYADASNAPSTLLASSVSQVLTANSWNVFTLPTLAIAANTRYWLAFNVDGANTKYAIKSGSRSAWKIPTTFGTWPATFGAPSSTSLEQYALYMSYTDTPPPPPPPPTTTTAPPPPPTGWPDATNTGVPAGTTLADYSAPCTITTAGTVIDSKNVTCDTLVVQAANVSITKSKTHAIWVDNDASAGRGWSVTVTDSEVDAGQVQRSGVSDGSLTLLRDNIHGGQNAVQCDEKSTVCDVRESWLHGQYIPDNQPWHLGGFLSDGNAAGPIALVHNSVVCDHAVNSVGEGCTADISFIPNFSKTSGVTVQNNLLGANIGSSYCTYGGEKSTSPFPHADHVVYTGNVFARGTNRMCGAYGPVTDFNVNATGNVWTNNTWQDDGTPVPPAN
jgi:hypothetical protein